MATIELSDGRVVPVVKPHLGDQMEVERQMRARNPKYGAADFAADMKLASFQTIFSLFATFNRAGIRTTLDEVFELDLDALSGLLTLEPGDGPVEDSGNESEQPTDPQNAETAAAAVEA